MKLGLFSLPAFFLLTLAALTVACGSDSDNLTLDEYFAEFAAIDDDADTQFEEAFTAFFPEDTDQSFFVDDANLPAAKELSAALPRITADALDRVQELDPPSELEDAHDDLVDAVEGLVDAFAAADAALSEAETMIEFGVIEAGLGSTGVEPATARFIEACIAVVSIGVANSIPVSDITCED